MASASSTSRPLRKAVLPVAGFGTRVLPATKAIPKEMLPVFDRPAIQYVVDEALAAGIEHIVFVTGRNKGAIEDYFDRAYELEVTLQAKNKTAQLKEIGEALGVEYFVLFVPRRSGRGAEVAVQLIAAATQAQLWVASYAPDSTNFEDIDADVVSRVTHALLGTGATPPRDT